MILCAVIPAQAEVLLFRDGDQLTGTWQRLHEGRLVFKSEALGDVTIPVAKIRSFSSEKTAVLLVKTGEAFRGRISLLESGDWELREGEGVMKVAASTVVGI